MYAADEQHLVIPAGARVLGEAKAVNTFGQSRLAVAFHRILLPNGTHIDLNGFHGLNQVGDLGLQDQVNRHYAQIFGVSLAIGAIAGFAQAQSSVGLDATGLDVYRQGVAANVSQSSGPHPRPLPQSAPHRDHPRGPPHQGVSRQRSRSPGVPRGSARDWRTSMIRRRILTGLLVLALAGVTVVPISAQLFGVVFDPTNYANALLRYAQLQQQLAQLITTYQQIRTQYLLLLQQSQLLPVNMVARYKSLASPWLPFTAPNAYGTTAAVDPDRQYGARLRRGVRPRDPAAPGLWRRPRAPVGRGSRAGPHAV